MQWAIYESLRDQDKEEFARLVSRLFEETFLLRDVWDVKERRVIGNRDYRFAERNLPLLKSYLDISGFELAVDGHRGVMALYHRYNRNRVRVDKLTTYLLYALRLIYEEQMESASMRREVVTALEDITAKLYTIVLIDSRIPLTHLSSAMTRLRQWSILVRVQGTGLEPESRWMIYPSITMAVPDERINDLYQRLGGGEFDGGADVDEEMDGAEPVEGPWSESGLDSEEDPGK